MSLFSGGGSLGSGWSTRVTCRTGEVALWRSGRRSLRTVFTGWPGSRGSRSDAGTVGTGEFEGELDAGALRVKVAGDVVTWCRRLIVAGLWLGRRATLVAWRGALVARPLWCESGRAGRDTLVRVICPCEDARA
jgi:hypothetical protein